MKKLIFAFLLFASPAVAQQACHPKTIVVASTNNATTIKATGGTICAYTCQAVASSTAMWLKFFNGSPTMGTTAADDNVEVASAASISVNTGPAGVSYPQGIYVAITGGQGLTNNTNAVAGDGTCTIYWN